MRTATQSGGGVPRGRLEALRAVASFELTKGVVVLLAGFGVLSLVHRNVWGVADRLLELLHINPEKHYAQVFLQWADGVTDAKLLLIGALAAVYSMMRFIEAYGLWRARAWAEWFALIAGAVYVPFELYDLIHQPTSIRAATLIVNLAIVAYMAYLRLFEKSGQAVACQP
jgi:uncharacterized membrane protein (DUF2068 family)